MANGIWRKIANLLYPPVCCRCKELIGKGSAFCDRCAGEYNDANVRACPTCFKKISECACVDTHLRTGNVRRLYKCYYYFPHKPDLPQNQLIFALKHKNNHYAYEFLADELSRTLRYHLGERLYQYHLTYIPASGKRMLEDGYDQMRELAKHLSKKLDIPMEAALVRTRKKTPPQKELSREERFLSVKGLYLPNDKVHIMDKKYILLDDVCTTGATLLEGASLLKRSGAKAVECAVIAVRPPKIRRTYRVKIHRK